MFSSSFSIWDLFRARFFWIMALILAGISGVFAALPLTSTLGFEYALFFGLAATVVSSHFSLYAFRLRSLYRWPSPGLAATVARIALAALALLVPALAVILLNLLRVPNCGLLEGFAFFGLLPVVGSFFGVAVGCLLSVFPGRKRLVAAVYLLPIAAILWAVAHGLRHPPIFAYSHFFGFFPGSLYDEQREISTTLILFRLLTVICGLFLVAVASLLAGRRSLLSSESPTLPRSSEGGASSLFSWREAPIQRMRGALDGRLHLSGPMEGAIGSLLLALLTGGILLGAWLSRDTLGYEHNTASVQRGLGGRVDTPNFVIFFDKDALKPEQIERMIRDHEFRYEQLVRFFGHRPACKIESYVFLSAEQKERYMGAGQTMIARPWACQIYIHGTDWPHGILKHELAHVFSADFGSGPLKLSASWGVFFLPAMIEGVAVAADWTSGSLDPHQWAKAMVAMKMEPDPAAILHPTGFFSKAPALSYRIAGSFIRYLVDTYGIIAYKRAYGTAAFQEVYQKSLVTLATEWRRHLQTKVSLSQEEMQLARYAFRSYRSIFARVCPHEVASLRQKIRSAASLERFSQALEGQRRICRLDTHPYNFLTLIDLLLEARKSEEAETLVKQMSQAYPVKTYPLLGARLMSQEISLLLQKGQIEEAKTLASTLYRLPLDLAEKRAAFIRLHALQHPPLTTPILRYLEQTRSALPSLLRLQEISLRSPHDPVLTYLLGRRLYFSEHYSEAIPYLQRALLGFKDLALRAETLRLLAVSDFALGRYESARQRFLGLSRLPLPKGQRDDARDWAERALWEARQYRFPPPSAENDRSRTP